MIRHLILRALCLCMPLFLTGCIKIFPDAGPAPKLYVLSAVEDFSDKIKPVNWQLLIEVPEAPPSLDTDKVAIKEDEWSFNYYSNTNWITRVPRLMQNLLVEAFENTDKIVGIGRSNSGLGADYLLKSDLRVFQAAFKKGETVPRVDLHLSAKLVKLPERTIIAARQFKETTQAESRAIRDVIKAYDRVSDAMQKKLIPWVLTEPEKYDQQQKKTAQIAAN